MFMVRSVTTNTAHKAVLLAVTATAAIAAATMQPPAAAGILEQRNADTARQVLGRIYDQGIGASWQASMFPAMRLHKYTAAHREGLISFSAWGMTPYFVNAVSMQAAKIASLVFDHMRPEPG